MKHVSNHAPVQSSAFTSTVTAILATAVTVMAGIIAFAPFLAPVTG